MKKSGLEQLGAYQLVTEKELKEMNSLGVVLRHKKTGARIFLMENDDEIICHMKNMQPLSKLYHLK